MDAPRIPLAAVAILAVGAVAAFYIVRKGSLSAAASGAAAAAVNAAGGAASGAVGAVGAAVGLPTPEDTTQDPAVARWLIDTQGWFEASKWSGVPALWAAVGLVAGSGTPPPRGSALAARFPTRQLTMGDFTRTDHGYDTAPSWQTPGTVYDPTNPTTWGIGL